MRDEDLLAQELMALRQLSWVIQQAVEKRADLTINGIVYRPVNAILRPEVA